MLVGGTALAGWQIRAYSRDVDLYMPEISPDAVEIVEQELRERHGPGFRLDVTTGENVWGSILVRDIAASPVVGSVSGLELRALRIEDLFLLKLAAGRRRDLEDLELLAPRTTADALVDRWNQIVKLHGDRHAVLGFADALVIELQQRYGCDPIALIARLDVTPGQRKLLLGKPSRQWIRMIGRSAIEQAVLDDEAVLEQVAGLLEARTALASWPEDLSAALTLALTDASMSRTEGWKAVTLRRHLFGPADRAPDEIIAQREPSSRDRMRAERLRADIPARIRYRAGVHLLKRPSGAT